MRWSDEFWNWIKSKNHCNLLYLTIWKPYLRLPFPIKYEIFPPPTIRQYLLLPHPFYPNFFHFAFDYPFNIFPLTSYLKFFFSGWNIISLKIRLRIQLTKYLLHAHTVGCFIHLSWLRFEHYLHTYKNNCLHSTMTNVKYCNNKSCFSPFLTLSSFYKRSVS